MAEWDATNGEGDEVVYITAKRQEAAVARWRWTGGDGEDGR
jgi:hypothetical protein